jgi:hypothetical protein
MGITPNLLTSRKNKKCLTSLFNVGQPILSPNHGKPSQLVVYFARTEQYLRSGICVLIDMQLQQISRVLVDHPTRAIMYVVRYYILC